METIVPRIGDMIAFYYDFLEGGKILDDDPDDTDFDALSYLEGYPDIPRCDGNKLYFISTVLDGTRYVLHTTKSMPPSVRY